LAGPRLTTTVSRRSLKRTSTEDLKSIDVPTLVMQGEDDQVVPYKGAALLQVKLLKEPTLKLYPGFPHGMLTTYSETINNDLLEFIKG